ncbi:hypothetical protein GS982_01700 [Rhodococcus hoagii]|uniref:Uncharacterized protein n=1 Tax=Rhodococcus hoagii TaxID=43767 RepID=A0A9Q5EYK4_RHOHA|nr:hypothetical protein [Prescottella equi]NKT77312.1 hypothetical protein [Prescottella equi]NKZ81099.1 hypothetical protein [Prescottella equi]
MTSELNTPLYQIDNYFFADDPDEDATDVLYHRESPADMWPVNTLNGCTAHYPDLENIRPAAVISLPQVTQVQNLGPHMRMYHTDTGIAIETKDEITLNQHIDNAAAAIAIKLERRKRDPNYLLTEKLTDTVAGGMAVETVAELLKRAEKAGLVKITV